MTALNELTLNLSKNKFCICCNKIGHSNKNSKYIVTISYIYDKKINYGTYGIGIYKKSAWYDGTWRITNTNRLNYTIK